jgi:hypothetical protein
VPLFAEELTKAVLESAAQGDRVAAVMTEAPEPPPRSDMGIRRAARDALGRFGRRAACRAHLVMRELCYS